MWGRLWHGNEDVQCVFAQGKDATEKRQQHTATTHGQRSQTKWRSFLHCMRLRRDCWLLRSCSRLAGWFVGIMFSGLQPILPWWALRGLKLMHASQIKSHQNKFSLHIIIHCCECFELDEVKPVQKGFFRSEDFLNFNGVFWVRNDYFLK